MRLKVVFGVAAAVAVVLCIHFFSHRPRQRQEQAGEPKSGAIVATTASRFGVPASAGQVRTAARTNQNSLLPSPAFTWEKADDLPEFASFAEWAGRFRNARTAEEKAALEPEGVALAQARRDALAELIQSDPKRALELTIPYGVRRALPNSIESLL